METTAESRGVTAWKREEGEARWVYFDFGLSTYQNTLDEVEGW